MKLEQQTQILLPTKIKKRKTIPPELLVDIFKTINTYPYELSRGLWKMYAEKLMTSSSIVYLSAGNAFRQCKKKIMSSSKNISFGEESKPIDMFSADEKQAIEILKNNDYSEDPSTNAYWALKFMNVLGAKRTLEKTNESYLSQIVALKSQIFLHEIQKSKLEKGLVASPGSVTGKSTGTPTGTGIVSPTGIKQSTSTSSVVNIVDQVCAVCETNPIKHLYKDHWICGSCYTRPIKPHAPCSNNGECKTYQLLKCPPCRLKKFSQLGIVKTPSKPESKKEEGSNERKRKLAELTGENPDIVCEDTPPQ